MDFLEIRKKAKERAARAGAAPASPAVPAAPPDAGGEAAARAPGLAQADLFAAATEGIPPVAPIPPGLPPPSEPVVGADDLVQGALAARLQGLPPAAEAPRFTTWRPGDGSPPFPLEERPPPSPRSDDPALAPPAPPRPPLDAPLPPVGPVIRFLEPPAPATPPRRRATLDDFFYRADEDAPGLEGLDLAPDLPAAAPAPVALDEFLTFRLGVEEYAVDIRHVREVLKSPPITEVPRAPSHVLGVVTVRGEVVAVFDPRRRLGLPGDPPAEGQGRIVIVDAGEGGCGLLVDAVSSVVRLPRGAIEPCPQGIAGVASDCLAGIGQEQDRLFTVLDLGALVRRQPVPRRAEGGPHAA